MGGGLRILGTVPAKVGPKLGDRIRGDPCGYRPLNKVPV